MWSCAYCVPPLFSSLPPLLPSPHPHCLLYSLHGVGASIGFDPITYCGSEADGFAELTIIASVPNLNGAVVYYTQAGTATAGGK